MDYYPTAEEFRRARRQYVCPWTWNPSRCTRGQPRLVHFGDERVVVCKAHFGRLRSRERLDLAELERVLTRAFEKGRT